jgi:hypothetical protein
MDWDEVNIRRLHRLFSDKCWCLIGASAEHIPDDSLRIWMIYLLNHGILADASINLNYDPDAPRLITRNDGSSFVRLINMWGDCYIDVPEEFATRTLVLGFLP